jgi:hypothetical protein
MSTSCIGQVRACMRLNSFWRLAAACLLIVLATLAYGGVTAQSEQAVARNLEIFFEAYLGRTIAAERRDVTAEFIRLHKQKGRDAAAIERIALQFASYAKTLREQKGGPADLSLRHGILEANYFQPLLKDSLELRLFTEPDPVRVANTAAKRLMTEKDIIGLVNLNNFSRSTDGEPRQIEFPRHRIDRLAVELNRIFGNRPNAGRMPKFCSESAALWAGIRQEWRNLNIEEKRQARAYAGKGFKAMFPSYKMYARLLGISERSAHLRRMDDLSAVALYMSELNALAEVITNELRKAR